MPSIAAAYRRRYNRVLHTFALGQTVRTMSDPPSPGSPPPFERSSDDRLDSWKEIATYMRRDVTTVQRWEKREAMPVCRHVHDSRSVMPSGAIRRLGAKHSLALVAEAARRAGGRRAFL
jgi:hypothetical protein